MGYGRTLSSTSALIALAIAAPAYPSARSTGLTDVTFVHAEKIGYGPEARDAAIHGARMEIAGLDLIPVARAA